jgi:hypothetical protein
MNLRVLLLNHYMDNPCLSNEIDYYSDEDRRSIYTEQILYMTDQEVIDAIKEEGIEYDN